VLANWCGRAVAELPPQASEVIHECGYLPLALAMIGAQLRGKREVLWNSVLDHLRHADLEKIKAQFPEPHTTLFRAIQISVDALDEVACQRYRALAVLLEDMAAAQQVQQCIWGVDESEAAETAEQFVALSLGQRDQPEGSICLHDLQLDYVRAQFPDKEALDLIHGAMRLSSNVIANDASQFAPQMVGRLVSYQDMRALADFSKRVAEGAPKPWLRPLDPALHPPGTALVRTLSGHSSSVSAVAASPDGQRGGLGFRGPDAEGVGPGNRRMPGNLHLRQRGALLVRCSYTDRRRRLSAFSASTSVLRCLGREEGQTSTKMARQHSWPPSRKLALIGYDKAVE
jgi:hypothetical protein